MSEKQEIFKKIGLFVENISKEMLFNDNIFPCDSTKLYILFLEEGEMELFCNDTEKFYIKKQSGIIIYNTSFIKITPVMNERTTIYRLTISGQILDLLLNYLALYNGFTFDIHNNILELELRTIIANYENKEYLHVSALLQLFLNKVVYLSRGGQQSVNMDQIYGYVYNHYAEPLSLDILAGLYGTSVSYFVREFKKYYKISPMQLVQKVRLDRAKHLLLTTKMRITEISFACGYEKMEYFCYVFKKEEGCTPSQYRLQAQVEHS